MDPTLQDRNPWLRPTDTPSPQRPVKRHQVSTALITGGVDLMASKAMLQIIYQIWAETPELGFLGSFQRSWKHKSGIRYYGKIWKIQTLFLHSLLCRKAGGTD